MATVDPALDRLEILKAFKRRTPRADLAANVTPFDDRVATAAGGPPADLADIHADIRASIRDTIADVRLGRRPSQVVLLAGAAGAGKTHLVQSLRPPAGAADAGHVFVGGSNHWTIGEFPARLLDWVIEALTDPTPTDDSHPLLGRVRAVGFRAVEHLLANPVSWKLALARPGGRVFGRLVPAWARPSHTKLARLAAARDPAVFRYFDFAQFSAYVCDRFLAERANPAHRYALRVLLTFLFPDRADTGIGSRERVLHWFRGRPDAAYFTRRLGAAEVPDRAYSQFEAVKLLAHLFSPAVSAQLSTDAAPCRPRVLLLTFDQAEGRDELFAADADWDEFFAHLSELYNTLPNVVVLFTMTLALRSRLHGRMERQFRDRIRMDERFTLAFPTAAQLIGVYRARVAAWLADDADLHARYTALADWYLPFNAAELEDFFQRPRPVRLALEEIDREFRHRIEAVAVDAEVDYVVALNAAAARAAAAAMAGTPYDYTKDHLATARRLLDCAGPVLAAAAGVELREVGESAAAAVPAVKLVFGRPGQSGSVIVHLARVQKHYTTQVSSLVKELLANREKARNFVWVVRLTAMSDTPGLVDSKYTDQFTPAVCPDETESALTAVAAVAAKRAQYTGPGQAAALDELIRTEIGKTYLGELFRVARQRLDDLATHPGGD